jgi:hypothetical protein
MIPGETRPEVKLITKPAGVYKVRFALLGDYKDASLDKSEVETDAAGTASLAITAPSSATTFSVRASVGESVSTSIGVSVSASGFGTLQVDELYDGERKFSYWMASVRTGVTCAELANDLLTDGDLTGSAPVDKVPQVVDVPVGPTLAVTLRGAFSVAGCQEVSDLAAGEITAKVISVSDLPMKLDETDLDVTLGIDSATGNFDQMFAPSSIITSSLIGAGNDVGALLDAMQESTADSAEAAAFQSARSTYKWDLALVPTLGGATVAPKAIRTLVEPWLLAGLATLPGDNSLQGRLYSVGEKPGSAQLELESVGGVPAKELATGLNRVSWKAEPGDTVLFGTDPALYVYPSQVLGALALGPAQVAVSGAGSVPEAVAGLLSCADVAQSMATAGTSPSCNEQCLASLCAQGLEILWSDFLSSSAATKSFAQLTITATADALVDDEAEPTSFEGNWVGAFTLGQTTLPVGGTTKGSKPPPPR